MNKFLPKGVGVEKTPVDYLLLAKQPLARCLSDRHLAIKNNAGAWDLLSHKQSTRPCTFTSGRRCRILVPERLVHVVDPSYILKGTMHPQQVHGYGIGLGSELGHFTDIQVRVGQGWD